jgi:hypothetical protein
MKGEFMKFKRLIQFKNAIKYFFKLNPNKEKVMRDYQQGDISLFIYKQCMR